MVKFKFKFKLRNFYFDRVWEWSLRLGLNKIIKCWIKFELDYYNFKNKIRDKSESES